MTFDQHAKAYLSIMGWPSGYTHLDRIEALVASIGMDPDQASIQAKAHPPSIVATVDTLICDEILRVLHNKGVLALAPCEDEIALYPKPEPIKRIARFPETHPTAFAADDNDEPAWTFTTNDIQMVVFGTTQTTTTKIKAHRPVGGVRRHGRSIPEPRITKSHQVHTDEVLDLHLNINNKPRLLRLTGQRTLIRSLQDIDNPPSLLTPPDPISLLKPHIPGVRINQGFASFNPPAPIRSKFSTKGHNKAQRTLDAFGFYSVWMAIIDQKLRGQG